MKDARLHPRFIDYRTPTNPHGLRFVEGAAGDTGGGAAAPAGQEAAGQPAATPAAPVPAPPPSAPQAGAQQAGEGEKGGGEEPGKVEDLPSWAQKIINEARDGEAKARTGAKAQAADEARTQLAQEIGKALGLVKDGEETKPEELLAQARTAQQEAEKAAADTARELAIYRHARTAGIDPDKVLDSRSAMAKLTDIDPTKADDLTNALKGLARDNTNLRARAAGASTIEAPGGTGERNTNSTRHISLEEGAASVYGT